jgi:hypothetical protein
MNIKTVAVSTITAIERNFVDSLMVFQKMHTGKFSTDKS